jgi:hypothetical protein
MLVLQILEKNFTAVSTEKREKLGYFSISISFIADKNLMALSVEKRKELDSCSALISGTNFAAQIWRCFFFQEFSGKRKIRLFFSHGFVSEFLVSFSIRDVCGKRLAFYREQSRVNHFLNRLNDVTKLRHSFLNE